MDTTKHTVTLPVKYRQQMAKYRKRKFGINRRRFFMVEITITNPCWHYVEGQKIEIPVLTNNKYNAANKVGNEMCGGEYPGYRISGVRELERGLFCGTRLIRHLIK